jgi:hypothetical protein
MSGLSKVFFYQKCLAKHLKIFFWFRGFHYKCCFHYAFGDNLSETNVFIKQIFRAVQLAPPFPPPDQRAVQGGGGSSGSFQSQAVALVMAMKQ